MKEIPAKGVMGYIMSSPFRTDKYFFRIYHENGDFSDYDINCEELEVELLSDHTSFYEKDDKKYLDWSSKALGIKKPSS